MTISGEDLRLLDTYLPFLADLSENDRQATLQSISLRSYSAGALIHDGVSCSGLIVIKSGQVRGFMESGGKEITLYRLLAGDVCVVTAACALKNLNFTILLSAESDCEIYLLPTKIFEPLNRTNLHVKDFVLALMSTRLSEVMWVVEQTVFSSFDKRLASFLLEQRALSGSDTITLTHDQIANHLGTAREVVTRMLRYFKSEGMVELSRGCISIVNPKKLRELEGALS